MKRQNKKSFVSNAINNSINGTDQTDQEILIGLIDELLQQKQAKVYSDTLIDAVHDLLGQNAYIDNLTGYKYDAVSLLGIFANSEVRKAIEENCKANPDRYVDFIQSLWYFMQRIDTELYKIQLLKHNIESFPDTYRDQIPELIDEFAERLRIEKSGKIKSYLLD